MLFQNGTRLVKGHINCFQLENDPETGTARYFACLVSDNIHAPVATAQMVGYDSQAFGYFTQLPAQFVDDHLTAIRVISFGQPISREQEYDLNEGLAELLIASGERGVDMRGGLRTYYLNLPGGQARVWVYETTSHGNFVAKVTIQGLVDDGEEGFPHQKPVTSHLIVYTQPGWGSSVEMSDMNATTHMSLPADFPRQWATPIRVFLQDRMPAITIE